MSPNETAIASCVVAVYPDHVAAERPYGNSTSPGSISAISRSWAATFK